MHARCSCVLLEARQVCSISPRKGGMGGIERHRLTGGLISHQKKRDPPHDGKMRYIKKKGFFLGTMPCTVISER